MSAVMVKCSEPKTAMGIAKNSRPNGMTLSTPCSCDNSPKLLMRPMMKSSDAQTYIQNVIAGMPNGTATRAGTTTSCWKQHSWICNAGRSPPGEFEWRHSKDGNQGKQSDCDQCTRFAHVDAIQQWRATENR